MNFLNFFWFFVLFLQTNAWRTFHMGRMSGGNLGAPACVNCSVKSTLVKTNWFPQLLDHFNPRNNTTWMQRYYVNDEYYEAGGPIFIMIGGEGEASDKWMTEGSWIDYAKKFRALLFQVEHRYYGKSHPTGDLSIKNLIYLSSEQALADLANFISTISNEYKLTGKWIAFGGSYSGSLAAWLRMKYPHLVHGAMSASGPLLAEVDFFDYFRIVDESLETYSEDCLTTVKNANVQLNLLTKEQLGRKKLDEAFRLCDPLESLMNEQKHMSNFWDTLANNFAGVVQYNKDNRIDQTAAGKITIDDVCGIMVNQSLGTPVDRLAAVSNLLLDANNETCLDYNYDKMIEEMRNITWNDDGVSFSLFHKKTLKFLSFLSLFRHFCDVYLNHFH
ncbi:hypothetical protein HHI36_020871 [Cryptolaemus montrouzieri]|uniref:Serine protease K12H4.7 n=1 Tax=Cryptolaemus montrouzieri TaxID=559131 RepID=A0ABD2NC00_9CUCU